MQEVRRERVQEPVTETMTEVEKEFSGPITAIEEADLRRPYDNLLPYRTRADGKTLYLREETADYLEARLADGALLAARGTTVSHQRPNKTTTITEGEILELEPTGDRVEEYPIFRHEQEDYTYEISRGIVSGGFTTKTFALQEDIREPDSERVRNHRYAEG